MKKLNPLYFIPAAPVILLFIFAVFMAGEDLAGIATGVVYLLLVLSSGFLLSWGKPWGALPGAVYYAGIAISDFIQNHKRGWIGEMKEYTYCIPVIIFYICCAVYVAYKNRHKDFKLNIKNLYKIWFFAPPVFLLVISYSLSGKHALTTPGMWIAIAVMTAFGVVMCKNKTTAAVAAAVFWLLWGTLPYYWHTDMFWKDTVFDMLLTIPMAAVYVICAVVIYKKNKALAK